MGLSDKERTEIIFEGINALVNRSIRFEDKCRDKSLFETGIGNRILREAKDLWRKILKINNNSSFWILGGDLRNVKAGEPTLWSTVIHDGLNDHSDFLRETGYDARDCLRVADLIRHVPYNGEYLEFVYEIYACVERMMYPLKRYDDNFRYRRIELESSLSHIQGLCHSVFAENATMYARAYVISDMVGYIYGGSSPGGGPYPDEDLRGEWGKYVEILDDRNLHHDMHKWMTEPTSVRDFDPIKKLHRELMGRFFDKKLMTNDGQKFRFLCALSLCRFTKEEEDRVRASLKKFKLPITKDIDLALKKCVAWQEEHKRDMDQSYADRTRYEDLSLYD